MMMNKLHCKPLCGRLSPAYPTKLQILATPQLLTRRLPPAWAGNRELAAVVGVFLAASTGGCRSELSVPPEMQKKPIAEAPAVVAPVTDTSAVVAPIFEHGEGRGSVGCIVVTSPVFLSEEEALQVILEELVGQGIMIDAVDVEQPNVKLPRRYEWNGTVNGRYVHEIRENDADCAPPPTTLAIDLISTRRHVAVEFISEDEYIKLGGVDSRSSVQVYDFQEAADNLSRHVEVAGREMYFGVFYDPVMGKLDLESFWTKPKPIGTTDEEWSKQFEQLSEAAKETARARSKEQLRLQVRDFVDWLKAQGVI